MLHILILDTLATAMINWGSMTISILTNRDETLRYWRTGFQYPKIPSFDISFLEPNRSYPGFRWKV